MVVNFLVNKKLIVQMLGGFSASYDGKPIQLEKSNTTKATQLFEYLLYNRHKKIPRNDLISVLYNNNDIDNPANNLKVNLFRLRKLLSVSPLPEGEYISLKSRMYSFNCTLPIEVDSEEFEQFVIVARSKELSDEEKLVLLQRAIEMYRGQFLPMIANEPWVVIESVRLAGLYKECVSNSCDILKTSGNYNLMLEICNRAVHVYPFDEDIHLLRISCLIDMKRYDDALAAYSDTSKLFFEEFGVAPSEKMLSLYQQMTNNVKLNSSTIDLIKDALIEKEKTDGAYYCNYLGFLDSYRFISRVIERNGQSLFLSLFTITDTRRNLLEPGEKLKDATKALHEVICDSLRRGDLYTRYSPNQFLVLLIGINFENCAIVANRINARFKDEKKIRGVRLHHSVTSGADLSSVIPETTFSNNPSW